VSDVIELCDDGEGKESAMIYCPGCKMCHTLVYTKPKDYDGPRWAWNGDREKPTFQPSLLVKWGKHVCHSFIADGEMRFLNDCTHSLAGKNVALKPF